MEKIAHRVILKIISFSFLLLSMTHSQGFRCKSRKVFRRAFRENGRCALTTIQRIYKRGDHVDILVNGSVHKGMPHRYYHGKTGVVFNVNPRAIGVEVNKRVGTRIMKKRIHVRVEHLRPSQCTNGHVARVAQNEAAKKVAGKAKNAVVKRSAAAPAAEILISKPKIIEVTPVPFAGIYV